MKETDINRLFTVLFIYTFVILLLIFKYVKQLDARKNSHSGARSESFADIYAHNIWKQRFFILAATALLLRILFAGAIDGFPSDISCFRIWSDAAAKNFISIYDKSGGWFIDYPPGYMYVLCLLGKIREIFHIPLESSTYNIILKLPSIICDIACGAILYYLTGRIDLKNMGGAIFEHRIFKRIFRIKMQPAPTHSTAAAPMHASTPAFSLANSPAPDAPMQPQIATFSERARLFIAAIYFFNPVVFFTSTIWGQVDSILSLMILLAVLAYLGDHFYASGVFYALAILIKPQGIIFLPVVFFMLLHQFIFRKDFRHAIKMIISALVTAIIIILPFSLRHGPLWIVSLYADTLSGYTLASMNAFNFFALIGGNWVDDSNKLFMLTYAAWGMIAIVVSTLLTGLFVFGKQNQNQQDSGNAYILLMGSALLAFSVVTFGHRMHERYFYPVLPLLLAAHIYIQKDGAMLKDKSEKHKSSHNLLLLLFTCLTLTGCFNILVVFSAYYTYNVKTFYDNNLIYFISALNVAAAIFMWIISLRGFKLNKLWHKRYISKAKIPIIILALFLLPSSIAYASSEASIASGNNAGAISIEFKNPGFDDNLSGDDASNMPPGWDLYDYRAQYTDKPETSRVIFDTDVFHSAPNSMRIESDSINDVRLYQLVPVEPNSYYRISCYMKTASVSGEGIGANISILGVYAVSDDLKGTHEEFQLVELYGSTGPNQKDLWVTVGLGGYSNESFGVAWFDDVALEKIATIPAGVNSLLLYNEDSNQESEVETEAQPNETSVGVRLILLLIILILLSLIALIVLRTTTQKQTPEPPESHEPPDSPDSPGSPGSPGPPATPGSRGSRGLRGPRGLLKKNESAKIPNRQESGSKKKSMLDRTDALIIAIMTAVYLVIALIRLGGFSAPQTYWKSALETESVVFEFEGPVTINEIIYNSNVIQHSESDSTYNLYIINAEGALGGVANSTADNASDGAANGKADGEANGKTDGETPSAASPTSEELLGVINNKAFYEWMSIKTSAANVSAVRMVATDPGLALNEIAFKGIDAAGREGVLPVRINANASVVSTSSVGFVNNLIDEQSTVPDRPDILNSTYFDEIYFARTAYEYLHSMPIYETTHPPLGKVFITIGILIFGMNPFGWRIMGTLAGAAMIPLMYIFAKKLFGKKGYAFCAAFLMMFDFMLFAQTRLCSIDSYATLLIIIMYMFMLDSLMNGVHERPLKDVLKPLCISGVAFGLGVSAKWIALYAGAGLAFLFLISRVSEIREVFGFIKPPAALKPRMQGRTARSNAARSSAARSRNPNSRAGAANRWQRYRGPSAQAGEQRYKQRMGTIIVACLAFFVLIPGIIYLLSYIPYTREPGSSGSLFSIMVNNQKSMLSYHSRLTDTHPFESIWWKWPIDVKPIWYYSASGLPATQIASIASFGNPLVWWTGIPCLIAAFILAYRKGDRQMALVFTAFLFQFAPWIFITRATFIYHYFSSVPFMIFAIVYIIRELIENKIVSYRVVGAYLAAVAVLFAAYYPILSGLPIQRTYANALKIFSTWIW